MPTYKKYVRKKLKCCEFAIMWTLNSNCQSKRHVNDLDLFFFNVSYMLHWALDEIYKK